MLDELAALLARVALRQVVNDFEGDELHPAELLDRFAKALAPEDVQLFYQTAIMGRRDLHLAPDPRVGFEMTLVRMLAFRPVADGQEVTRSGAPLRGTPTSVAGGAARGPEPASQSARASAPSPVAVSGPQGSGDWSSVLAALELQGSARQLANNCVLIGRKGSVVRLALDPRSQTLRTRAQEEKLAQALSRYYGETVRIEFEITASPGVETPAQADQRSSREEVDAARRALESDPGARALRERFGATLIPDTVRPLK